MSNKSYINIFLTLLILLSCSGPQSPDKQETKETSFQIYVSNYPLYFFVESLAGELVEIQFPAKESGDPAFWDPDPEAISKMQQADLILLNGASYEKWLENISLPVSKQINTAQSYKDRLIKIREKVAHTHGPQGEHEHSGTAFTTWLDLSLAIQQAANVKEALINALPDQKDAIEKNFENLKTAISALDSDLVSVTEELTEIKVLFSHPVYQYFENRYNIEGISLHWEPDTEPDESMWKELEDILKKESIKYMIWEDQPLPGVEKQLNELGVSCIVFNPCGNVPEEGDFLSAMRRNIENLKKIEAQ